MSFVHTPGCSHIAAGALSPYPALLVLDTADIAELSNLTGFTCVGDTTLLQWRVMLA